MMSQINIDLEDGLPPISFAIKTCDEERFMRFMAENDAAVNFRDSVPADYVLMPAALTAENGAKQAMIMEYSFMIPEVDEDGNEHMRTIYVPWTTIKTIYKGAVNLLGKNPAEVPQNG